MVSKLDLKRLVTFGLLLTSFIPLGSLAQSKLPPNEYPQGNPFIQQSNQPIESLEGSRYYSNRLVIELSDPRLYNRQLMDMKVTLNEMAEMLNVQWVVQFKLGARFVVVELQTIETDEEVKDVARRLQATPGVLNVDIDPLVQKQSISLHNDTRWVSQFDLFNATGTKQNFVDADYYLPNFIGLFSVADLLPMDQVTVAVIDSGYKTGFNDINESTVDHEVSILNGEYSTSAIDSPSNPSNSHGTETAATIFAVKNNASELAGLIPEAQSVMIKVFQNNGSGVLSDAAAGILYAVNRHDQSVFNVSNPFPADVINLSLGAPHTTGLSSCPTYLQDAINQAVNAGALVVASSGNLSSTFLDYPAGCNNVISVGAANSLGRRSNYSNANGNLLVSTFGGDPQVFSFFPVLSTLTNKTTQGTSNAGPLVTSVLAMAKSVIPGLSYSQVASVLEQTGLAFSSDDSACAGKVACGVLFDPVAFLLGVGAIDSSMLPSPDGLNQNNPGAAQVQTSAVATSISDVVVYDVNQQVVANASVNILADAIEVELAQPGTYTIRFRGVPVTNTSAIKPSADGDGKQTYEVSITWEINQPVSVGQIVPLSSGPDNLQSVAASKSGGGSLGLLGLLSLMTLCFSYTKLRQVRKPLKTSVRSG